MDKDTIEWILSTLGQEWMKPLTWLFVILVVTPLLLRVIETLSTFTNKRRKFLREKEQLEILKLKYEIDAIKKEHELQLDYEIEDIEESGTTWYSYPRLLHEYLLNKLEGVLSRKTWYSSILLLLTLSFTLTLFWSIFWLMVLTAATSGITSISTWIIVLTISMASFYVSFGLLGNVYKKYNQIVYLTLVAVIGLGTLMQSVFLVPLF